MRTTSSFSSLFSRCSVVMDVVSRAACATEAGLKHVDALIPLSFADADATSSSIPCIAAWYSGESDMKMDCCASAASLCSTDAASRPLHSPNRPSLDVIDWTYKGLLS